MKCGFVLLAGMCSFELGVRRATQHVSVPGGNMVREGRAVLWDILRIAFWLYVGLVVIAFTATQLERFFSA